MKVKSRDRRNYIAIVEATNHAHPRKYFIAFLRESRSEVVFYSNQSNVKAKRTNKKFDKIKAKFYTEAFLDLIDKDIVHSSSFIEPLTEDLYHRAEALTKGMTVDFNEELPEDFIFA